MHGCSVYIVKKLLDDVERTCEYNEKFAGMSHRVSPVINSFHRVVSAITLEFPHTR